MSTPGAVNHALLRPCILHILRAAGYHATKPSVLDALTDLAARYMATIASTTLRHSHENHSGNLIDVGDIRLALQELGALMPEKPMEDEDMDGQEDMRGMQSFLDWCTGSGNRQIRHIALEGGEDARIDYLDVLKKKHSTTDEDARYVGTLIGKPVEMRPVQIEGAEITSITEWATRLMSVGEDLMDQQSNPSQVDSSDLSSIPDSPIMSLIEAPVNDAVEPVTSQFL